MSGPDFSILFVDDTESCCISWQWRLKASLSNWSHYAIEWLFLGLRNSSAKALSSNGIVLADSAVRTGNWAMHVDLSNGFINRAIAYMGRGLLSCYCISGGKHS